MPELRIEKIDASHDRLIMEFASTSQQQGYYRIFPDPVPSTHQLVARWEPSKDGRHPARVLVSVVPRDIEMPGTVTSSDRPTLAGAPAGLVGANVADLSKMKDDDLETLAAEKGVAVKDAKGKKLSRSQVVAELAKA